MIIDRYIPIWGGAENQLRQLIPHLKDLGCDIVVLTRRWDKSMKKYELIDNVPVHRMGFPGEHILATISYLWGLVCYTLCNRKTIDIIHTHGAVALGAVGRILGWLNHKPNVAKVASANRIPAFEKNIFCKAVLAIFKRSDAIICLSAEINNQLNRIKVSSHRIQRINNAVNGKKFAPYPKDKYELFRTQRGLNITDPVILFSGNFRAIKGLDVLIDAWPKIYKSYPEAHLFILGSSKYKSNTIEEQIFKKVKEGGIPNLHFEGDAANPEDYLGIADILVLPSRMEGMSNTLLEAMASGLATVSSNIGGVADIVNNKETGLLVPAENINETASAITSLLNNPILRRKIGQKAHELVFRNFTFKNTAKQYYSLYIKIV